MQLLAFASLHITEFGVLEITAIMTYSFVAHALTLPYFDYYCQESETGCIYILIDGMV